MRRNYTAAGWGGADDQAAAAEGGSKGTATRAALAVHGLRGESNGGEGKVLLLLLLAASIYLGHPRQFP